MVSAAVFVPVATYAYGFPSGISGMISLPPLIAIIGWLVITLRG